MCSELNAMVEAAQPNNFLAEAVCASPRHPCTATLIAAATAPGRQPPWPVPIMGEVPNPLDAPSGCAFHPRCPYVMPECRQALPPFNEVEPHRWVACHLYPDKIRRASSEQRGRGGLTLDAEVRISEILDDHALGVEEGTVQGDG
jgi:oligopeptide/dipeptide ABC transporter ATP-binding protein